MFVSALLSIPTPMIVGAALVLINLTAFLTFAWDKACAINGDRRVSEATLLWLALLGGSAGAKSAQHIFRHKTRKEPFRTTLNGVIVFQIILAAAMSHAPTRIAITDTVMSQISNV